MTEVAFHFNAPDKLGYACRLLRKATASGARVVVTGEPELLRQLDVALWTFSPLEFIPHGYIPACGADVAGASPVVLADSAQGTPHQQVLVNLGTRLPDGFERFERLIEVVTQDDGDRQQARQRWKHYADRGYAIVRHDLATREQR
jgi:DNA polymerase-3 subunit chi